MLRNEVPSLRQEMAKLKELKKEVQRLTEGLNNAYKIIHNQQLYLGALDNKEQRSNLVITKKRREKIL